MSFEIKTTEPFERKIKRLSKKYNSLTNDVLSIVEQLTENPTLGIPLGRDCYKIRVHISSKGKGKSGGARMITYVLVLESTVFLLDIFDKSEQSTISNKELQKLIDKIQSSSK